VIAYSVGPAGRRAVPRPGRPLPVLQRWSDNAGMSAIGTQLTLMVALSVSAFRSKGECRVASQYANERSLVSGSAGRILVCPDGQRRAREVGLPVTNMSSTLLGRRCIRGKAGPGNVRGAGRLLAAADRDDLGVARGSMA